MNAPA